MVYKVDNVLCPKYVVINYEDTCSFDVPLEFNNQGKEVKHVV